MEKGRIGLYTLLIVDDEEIEREGMAQFIPWDTYGMKVVGTARNGAEGLEKIAKYKPDLAIVDIKMPVMDGLPAERTIRAMYRRYAKTIPIIAMTANAFDEDRKRSREAGMNGHLAKPLNIQDIIGTIAECIQCTSS